MQADEANENSPDVGIGDCSIADDDRELDAALVAMLRGVPEPLHESLPSTSELVAMHPMLDSWESSAQTALLEEPLDFVLDATESGPLEQMTMLTPRCHTHSNAECLN